MNVTRVPFLDLGRAYQALQPEIDECIHSVARSGRYILGENAAELEGAMADYLGVPHAVACASGTDALYLGLVAAGIGSDDEVITTPFTFAATLEAIEHTGARAVLVDIRSDTFDMDPAAIEGAIGSRTRAIVPVHMFGLPADMNQIMEIASRHDLRVFEDCAQSLGARIGGVKAGAFGSAAALSFYPSKTLGCLGDGGMVVTADAGIRERLIELRNHGFAANGEHVVAGFNSRLDEIQAAVLRLKLPRLDRMNSRRRQIAERFIAALTDTAAVLPDASGDAYHVYGYFTIRVPNRDAVRRRLRDFGIATAVYYPKPLHRQPHYSKSTIHGELPVAEAVCQSCVSLPIFPEMTDEEVEYVAARMVDALAEARC